jgi:2-polyprenyl-6-methoxyphenol hydroxylase-like FAD-dependent oxidoreductase
MIGQAKRIAIVGSGPVGTFAANLLLALDRNNSVILFDNSYAEWSESNLISKFSGGFPKVFWGYMF